MYNKMTVAHYIGTTGVHPERFIMSGMVFTSDDLRYYMGRSIAFYNKCLLNGIVIEEGEY